MTDVILLMGLFVTTLFDIAMYGPGGVDPDSGTTWVENAIFGIMGIATLPAIKAFLAVHREGFRQRKLNR